MITEAELSLWHAERTLTDPAQKIERYDRLLDELRNAWDLLATMSRAKQLPFGRKSDPAPVLEEQPDGSFIPDGPEIGLPEIFR